MTLSTPGFSTLAVHAGATPDATTQARVSPIYQTASFVLGSAEDAAALFGLQKLGHIDSRVGNPTNAVLEERITALEGGTAAVVLASGHAARLVVMHTLMQPGDEVIVSKKIDAGAFNQFSHAYGNFGWTTVWADPDDPASLARVVSPRTKAIFIEAIAYPGGVVSDIAAIAAVARQAGVPLIVDNSLATPYLCRPIEHGADIVVHSLTGFLGGHGRCVGGVIVDGGQFDWSRDGRYPMMCAPRPEYDGMILHEAFGNFAFATACRVLGLRDLGPALAPFNAFLILAGIETLALRMQRHCQNALAVAEWLRGHARVAWVSYAGLPGDRYHNLAERYLANGAGAVFTLALKDGRDAALDLISRLKLFSHVAGVGDTRSLIHHPASTTHRPLPDAKSRPGAAPDVVRVSIGIEDKADLIADLEQALA